MDDIQEISEKLTKKKEEFEAAFSDIADRKRKLFQSQIPSEALQSELDLFFVEEKKAFGNLGEAYVLFSEELINYLQEKVVN